MPKKKHCGGNTLQNKFLLDFIYIFYFLIFLFYFFTITSVRLLYIDDAPDILADKLDLTDNYRFFSGPVRHGNDILAPLAHWCG